MELVEDGRAAFDRGAFQEARMLFERALSQSPDNPECWFLLGASCHRLNQLDAAREAFERSCLLNPGAQQSRLALASICLALNDSDAAVTACLEAVAVAPESPDAWFSLGVAYNEQGAQDSALAAYDKALALAPGLTSALTNRRSLLMSLGRYREAVLQCQATVATSPYSFDAQFHLGVCLTALGEYREALQAFRRAEKIDARSARLAMHIGFVLAQLCRFDDAQKMLDRAIQLDPRAVQDYREQIFGKRNGHNQRAIERLDAKALYLLAHFDKIERCNWTEREVFIADFGKLIESDFDHQLGELALGFRAMAMGLDPGLQRSLADRIATGIKDSIERSASAYCAMGAEASPNQRLHIGFMSADFRSHPVSLLIGDMFAMIDRSKFEISCYSIGADDRSEVRQVIVDSCDHFVDLSGVDDEQAAALIRRDSVDVLVDLVGYMDGARPRILAYRPARMQVLWLNYLTTSGAPWIDYAIVDKVVLPDDMARHFSEAPIYLPGCMFFCAYADRRLPQAPSKSFAELPEGSIVLAAMHNHYKIDPDVFAVWMRLLGRNDRAVLWLLEGTPASTQSLREAAMRHGVSPQRLIFAPKVPHDTHLARLQLADMALDTPQCNGGTTTADALVANVPVVACAGRTMMQRIAGSLLHAAGLGELVSDCPDGYEQLADDLISSAQRRHHYRALLQAARSSQPFFLKEQWVTGFEVAICQAWAQHCSKEGSQPVEVVE